MRITAPILTLFLIAGSLLGQVSNDAAPPKKPGTVEGTILNSVSHEPVKKANVSLRSVRQRFFYSVVSDAEGHFLFENVEPGTYQVDAERDGFTRLPNGPRSPASKPITVDEEQHVKNVTAQLMPMGVVSGHVLDEDGDPIAGASVQAQRFNYFQGRKQLSPWGSATTNDLGEFELLNLQPGRYYFQVTAPRRMVLPPHTRGVAAQEAYPSVYYPNAMDISQATSQELQAGGQLSGIDFRLHKVRSYLVSGKVLDGQTGQPARNVFVQLRSSSFSFGNGPAQMQQNGTFEIRGVVPGSYIATAELNDGEIRTTAQLPIHVTDQDIDGVVLTLKPGFDVSGTITVEGAPPAAQPNVPSPATRPPMITLQPNDQMVGRQVQGSAENDGTFVLHGVAPETYRVNVQANIQGEYVKSIQFGDQDVPSGQIDLTQQSSAGIHVVLGTDPGQIQGVVQDRSGQPAAGVMITLVPPEEYGNRLDLFKQSFSDSNGSFQFRDLAPGSYKVFGWENPDMDVIWAPEFRKAFESKAASANIGPNGKESVQLTMITAEEIQAEKSKLP